MGITPASVRWAVARAADTARAVEADLNAADARLGDGDTGVTVRRLFEALDKGDLPEGDLGETFAALARICAGATGSSLGTLVTVAMMTLAKAVKGQAQIAWTDLPPLLAEIRDRMLARGGASLGDKTMVDMLDAVARAGEGCATRAAFADAADRAAAETLEAFRDRPNRIGRARMFGERSIGQDDPGMLAFRRLLDGLIAAEKADV